MSDLINRQDAIDALDKHCNNVCQYSKKQRSVMCGACPLGTAFDVIEELPSAQKKGEWLWSPIDKDGTVSGRCSECSFSHIFIGGHTAQYQYCPSCGADMRKGGETMSKLKPCPFCGKEAVIDDCGEHRYFVRCSKCGINQDKLYAQKCDAVKAWNRRVKNDKRTSH